MDDKNLDLFDATNLKEDAYDGYLGANGAKICVFFQGERYMIKFPPAATKRTALDNANSCISEYIGCHIYESIGIPVQKTYLWKYRTAPGKEKVVVGCKDFAYPNAKLLYFAALKNKNFNSSSNGYGTELKEIEETFEKQKIFNPEELSNHFWNMFIVDALIGNWDRHNGNWGYLYDQKNNTASIAPVYDCASCLYAQIDEESMKEVLTNPQELKHRVYDVPTSAIKIDDRRIVYREFICSLENKECNEALKRIYPRIDIKKISKLIDETPVITELQKKFYKKILEARYNLILTSAYKKLIKQEKSKSRGR